MTPTIELSRNDARRLALTAQGLIGTPFSTSPATAVRALAPKRELAVTQVLETLGAVQLDTISVLARSHELVAYARLGAVGRSAVESAYWTPTPDEFAHSFEYWSHAACILPAHVWPWFAFRRRNYVRKGIRWHEVPTQQLQSLRARLRAEGPLTTAELGGAKKSSQWWDWSDAKIGIEWLLDIGEVVCSRRVGWRRVYDLPERALDPDVFNQVSIGASTWSSADGVEGPTDDECLRTLIARATATVGVGTVTDILDVHRLRATDTSSRARLLELFDELVESGDIVQVTVPGWKGSTFADAQLLASPRAWGRNRTTLLSPFDSLVWHRGRTNQVFEFEHSLEAYVPAAKRVHGYFTMPVLHGGQLVARVDPKRQGDTLAALTVTFETPHGTASARGTVPDTAIAGTATALREAAAWVGCSRVVVGDVRPRSAKAALVRALT